MKMSKMIPTDEIIPEEKIYASEDHEFIGSEDPGGDIDGEGEADDEKWEYMEDYHMGQKLQTDKEFAEKTDRANFTNMEDFEEDTYEQWIEAIKVRNPDFYSDMMKDFKPDQHGYTALQEFTLRPGVLEMLESGKKKPDKEEVYGIVE